MAKPKRVVGKWQFVFTGSKDFMRLERGWYVADVGIFKLTSLPSEGMKPTKRNYKGFWLRFWFWLPLEKY